ncbi:mechanosensitive ion channel protein [archaeon SCG-AAA382B04]|nr:mechanosensitive ion channel protein [archaeon SCG-AAA382B04]
MEPIPYFDQFFGSYALGLTQLVYFLVSFLVTYLVGTKVVIPIIDRVLGKYDLEEHARKPLNKIIKILVVFIAISIAFGFAGYGNFLTSLATIGAAATLAIGFALQDIIKNFVSGIFIFVERPFEIGDWIEWDEHKGIVEDISLRVSRVRTFDNEMLTVPNFQLTNGVIKNPVAKDKLRVKFVFGISYEDDIEKATEIITEEAKKDNKILNQPEPVVRLSELADSFIGLKSMFWIKNPSRSDFMKIKSDYIKNVKQRFDQEDIEIPFPQIDISGQIETK